jgi:hypothetical protein
MDLRVNCQRSEPVHTGLPLHLLLRIQQIGRRISIERVVHHLFSDEPQETIDLLSFGGGEYLAVVRYMLWQVTDCRSLFEESHWPQKRDNFTKA